MKNKKKRKNLLKNINKKLIPFKLKLLNLKIQSDKINIKLKIIKKITKITKKKLIETMKQQKNMNSKSKNFKRN